MPSNTIPDILRHSPVEVLFGPGRLADLGQTARNQNAVHALLVTDPGIMAAGHADFAADSLRRAGITVTIFDGARENPTTDHVAAGILIAGAVAGAPSLHSKGGGRRNTEDDRSPTINCIIALGGGSAMDCAKGINLILTNGGQMSDYRGDPPPDVLAKRNRLLPMILVPTTAGTGSEAQSFALISDAVTHEKMACGDRRPPLEGGLRPRVTILDPDLIRTAPPSVAAAAGIDAIAHAVETAASLKRNDISRMFSIAAWQRLDAAFERYIADSAADAARADMLMGAHLAGAAIEHSMLGAAHACSNPLTARFGIAHGRAVGLMLPHVVRFNARGGTNPYADICDNAESLARRIESLLDAAQLPRRLSACGIEATAIDDLSRDAAQQWTARFNPIPVTAAELRAIYQSAW